MATVLQQLLDDGFANLSAEEVCRLTDVLSEETKINLLRACNYPIAAIAKIDMEATTISNYLRLTIDLYRNNVVKVGDIDHNSHGADLIEVHQTDLVGFTLGHNTELLDQNEVKAGQIAARVSEYIDDNDKFLASILEIQKEQLELPDLHETLAIKVLDFDEINLATFEACERNVWHSVFKLVSETNLSPWRSGFMLAVPEHLQNAISLLLIIESPFISRSTLFHGLFVYKMFKFRIIPNPHVLHKVQLIWMDSSDVIDLPYKV